MLKIESDKTKKFLATKRIRIGKYFLSVGLIVGGYIISPIWSKGLEHSILVWKSMFKDIFNIIMTLFFPIIAQIYTNFLLRKHVRRMCLTDYKITLELYGIFKQELLEINYKDILYLEYTKDEDQNFLLKMRNDEEKIIHAQIQDKEKAFDLIQEKIKEVRFI